MGQERDPRDVLSFRTWRSARSWIDERAAEAGVDRSEMINRLLYYAAYWATAEDLAEAAPDDSPYIELSYRWV